MEERKDEDVLAGVLTVRVGGRERELPIRSIASAREWKRSLIAAFGGDVAAMSLDSMEDGGNVIAAVGDRILDLVVGYDETAALGGREYLEANATDQEIYAIFRRLLSVSFPFVGDLRTAFVELRALGLAELLASGRSVPARSTSPSSESSDSGVLVASSSS